MALAPIVSSTPLFGGGYSGGGGLLGLGSSGGTPSTSTSASPYNSNLTATTRQAAGNNYPAGIYGPGPGGSGTALGTVTNDELVQNRLTGLLAQDSPYIQQARNQAIQQANSRGALNSSIAAGNAQGAAIQAALPIASQDASTTANLQTTNLNNLSKEQIEGMAAGAQITSASLQAGAMTNSARINQEGDLWRQRENLAYQGEQAGLNRSFTQGELEQSYLNQYGLNNQMAGINSGASYQNYLQNSAMSGQGYQQNLGLGEFNLGGSLLQGQQSFYQNLGLQGLSNPGLIGDPQALGGYAQFISGLMGGSIDNIFNYVLGGGNYSGH